MQNYTIYNDADYFKEITRCIANTGRGDQVLLTSMTFEPSEPLVQEVMRQLILAAKRGANVHLIIDAHTFMLTKLNKPLGPMYWRRDIFKARFPRRFHEKIQWLEELRQAGGNYEIINRPTTWPTVPIAGRSHIKTTIINDDMFIGGCNLGHTGQIDYMVRVRDTKAVTWVRELIADVLKRKSTWLALGQQDRKLAVDELTALFVDAGVVGQSLILEEALRLIDETNGWIVITCQFLPGGVTGQHLAQAQSRGVRVYSVFNHLSKQDKISLPAHYFIRQREKLRQPKSLFAGELPRKHQRLHAKLIATEKGAMIGSHNYVSTGVRLGTAEIALLRYDPAFARQAISILLPQLTGSIGQQLRKDFG